MVDFTNYKSDEEPECLRLIREQMSVMTKPLGLDDGVSMHDTFSFTPDYDVKKFHTTFEIPDQRIRVGVSDHGVTGPSRWRPRLEPMSPSCEARFDDFQQAHAMAKRWP